MTHSEAGQFGQVKQTQPTHLGIRSNWDGLTMMTNSDFNPKIGGGDIMGMAVLHDNLHCSWSVIVIRSHPLCSCNNPSVCVQSGVTLSFTYYCYYCYQCIRMGITIFGGISPIIRSEITFLDSTNASSNYIKCTSPTYT